MSIETGIKIKEARTAAGISQAALAKEAGCVTATDISKAERGLKELTPEQMAAVAKALGMNTGSSIVLSAEDQELLALYRAADDNRKKAAIAALKGEPQIPEPAEMLNYLIKSGRIRELIPVAKNMLLGMSIGDVLGLVKKLTGDNGMLSNLKGMFGIKDNGASMGSQANAPAAEGGGAVKAPEISNSLLAFTFFYAVTIYILLLSFYFWLWRRDIKPEK